jgi:CDP-diacylglycerol--glycerol-3-phosphate 3-phosphatidyltransferase
MDAARWYWAFAVLGFSMCLDFLDGAVAEARGSGTEFGKFLDPTADKAVVWSVWATLTPRLPRPLADHVTAVGITLAFTLTALRAWRMWRGVAEEKKGIAANRYGKAKLVTETTAIGTCLVGLGADAPALVRGGTVLMAGSLVLAALSLWGQLRPKPPAPPGPTIVKAT